MSEFTFVDGTQIPKDNWICLPHAAMMSLPEVYSKPKDFNGFRFVKEDGQGAKSTRRFWDMSREFPFWGNPKTGWYVIARKVHSIPAPPLLILMQPCSVLRLHEHEDDSHPLSRKLRLQIGREEWEANVVISRVANAPSYVENAYQEA